MRKVMGIMSQSLVDRMLWVSDAIDSRMLNLVEVLFLSIVVMSKEKLLHIGVRLPRFESCLYLI